MKKLLLLLAALALTGCASNTFENVLTTSLNGDRAFMASMYGRIGFTSELREADAVELAKLRRQAGLAAAGFSAK